MAVNPAKIRSIASTTRPAIRDQQATERRSNQAKLNASEAHSRAPADARTNEVFMAQACPGSGEQRLFHISGMRPVPPRLAIVESKLVSIPSGLPKSGAVPLSHFRWGRANQFNTEQVSVELRGRRRAQRDSTTVAQTGSLPYRGLAIREAFPLPLSMACRMPFSDTAD